MDKKTRIKIAPVKGLNEERGTLDFTLTSKTVDRDSEVVIPRGVNLEHFVKNPVFLWAHSRKDPSIGRIIPETIKVTDEEINATVEFDLEDPFAAMIFNKYKKQHLNAVSIGFIPKEFDKPILDGQIGPTFNKSELLEVSGVPVQSNTSSLSSLALAKEFESGAINGDWWENFKKFCMEYPEGDEQAWCKYTESCLEEKQSILPLLIDDMPNSFEWIQENLNNKAYMWLKQYPDISGEEYFDFAPLVATYDDRAILTKLNLDLPFSQAPCFEGRWSIKNGYPEWEGEPRPVEISIEIIRKIYDRLTTEREFGLCPGKGVVGYSAYPTVDEDLSWDGSGARNRVAKWASSDESGDKDKINWNKYRKAFSWYDEEKTDQFGAYKLPHHDIIDGELKTVWRGVSTAMGALLGARGGTTIPDSEKKSVYNHLAKHYKQFDKEPPEYKMFQNIAAQMIDLYNNTGLFEPEEIEIQYQELTRYYEAIGLKAPELPIECMTDETIINNFQENLLTEITDYYKEVM